MDERNGSCLPTCLQVRDAMAHIWHALLDDPKAAVTQHFDGKAGHVCA